MLSMDQLSLAGKRVLIREDLNVPLRDGRVANDCLLYTSDAADDP